MTAQEFLLKKGITKVHQKGKFVNLTIGEIIEMLVEFSSIKEKTLQKILEMNMAHSPQVKIKSIL